MYVCICAQVRETKLRETVAAGAHDLAAIGAGCGAGTGCGHCLDRIEDVIDEIAGHELPAVCGSYSPDSSWTLSVR